MKIKVLTMIALSLGLVLFMGTTAQAQDLVDWKKTSNQNAATNANVKVKTNAKKFEAKRIVNVKGTSNQAQRVANMNAEQLAKFNAKKANASSAKKAPQTNNVVINRKANIADKLKSNNLADKRKANLQKGKFKGQLGTGAAKDKLKSNTK